MIEGKRVSKEETWAWGLNREEWRRAYRSQGPGTNDCGLANLVMLLNALTDEDWDKTSVHPRLRFPDLPAFLDKFINFITCGKFNPQEVVGATHPKGFVWEFNRIAKRRGLERRARRVHRGTKSALVGEVQKGNPVTVILVWEDGGAHYVTVLSYSHLADEVFLLDPDDEYKDYPPSERVRSQPWVAFEENWSRRAWWGKLLGLKNEMVVIS